MREGRKIEDEDKEDVILDGDKKDQNNEKIGGKVNTTEKNNTEKNNTDGFGTTISMQSTAIGNTLTLDTMTTMNSMNETASSIVRVPRWFRIDNGLEFR